MFYLLKKNYVFQSLNMYIYVYVYTHIHAYTHTHIKLSSEYGKTPNIFINCQKVIQKKIKTFHI